MGTVWLAQQTEPVRRPVALKLVKAGMDTRAVLARFDAERQALAVMDHPNIAKVLDAGETGDGRPFFVMELVPGVPITKFCDDRCLGLCERLGLFVQVCQAVQHAHQKGVIHRDIKPSNVLVSLYDDFPAPKVIDFGIAKAAGEPLTEQTLLTGHASVVGTPEYMSPEQASFDNLDIDTRSDVYALRVLLYELLAGSPPFGGNDLRRAGLLEFLRVVREVDPPRPSQKLSTSDALPSLSASRGAEPARLAASLRGELDWIVMKALEKDRARRYATADALARDVRRFLADEVVEARPPSRGYLLRKFVRRHRGQVITALVVMAALSAGVIGTSVGLFRAEQSVRREAAVQAQMRRAMTRQMADRLQSDMMRLAAIGNALAATVKQGQNWNERQIIDWMNQTIETEPEVLGLSIAFEPGTFDPVGDPATVREPFRPLLPLGIDAIDPCRDGYSLYVLRQEQRGGNRPVAEALKREYRYRTQPWYRNTLTGAASGWEREPAPDRYGPMVAYTMPLYSPGGQKSADGSRDGQGRWSRQVLGRDGHPTHQGRVSATGDEAGRLDPQSRRRRYYPPGPAGSRGSAARGRGRCRTPRWDETGSGGRGADGSDERVEQDRLRTRAACGSDDTSGRQREVPGGV
jgi:hypothetical protein